MTEFVGGMQTKLTATLARFGCRQRPTVSTLQAIIIRLARFEFLTKPQVGIQAISSGIPQSHRPFWKQMTVKNFNEIYVALSASPSKVLELLNEPDVSDSNQQRVLGYLRQYIGSMQVPEVQRFLSFVTGSSVCSTAPIIISFNSLTGAGRRPIAHTCSSQLIISSDYRSFDEFTKEFRLILFGDEGWRFDAL